MLKLFAFVALPHSSLFFFFNDTATTEIYTLSLHDALPISYVCPEAACVEHALSRGRLAHAFKKPCAPSPDLAAEVQAAGDRGAGAPAGEASSGCDMFETGAMAVRA